MSASDWRIIVRDKFRNRVGEIAEYKSLVIRQKWNDVSTWQLTLDRYHFLAPNLVEPGAGIIIERLGDIVFSGVWTERDERKSLTENELVVSGVDDVAWLARRLAYPDPNDITPPTFPTQENDARSGQASTILRQFVDQNLGVSGAPTERAQVLVGGNPFVGATLTNSGRWQTVLQLCQDICNASEAAGSPVGFNVVQSGSDLQFQVFSPSDLTSTVIFSEERGTLGGFEYKQSAPSANYVLVGDDAEGTARNYVERYDSTSIAAWGRIEGPLVDARNSADSTERAQDGDNALLEAAETASLAITPVDIDTQKYLDHYALGDKVTVVLDPIGRSERVVTATATGQGTSFSDDYIIVWDTDAANFPIGSRVQIKNSSGLLKTPVGVRTIRATQSAFGFTNLFVTPNLFGATFAGDVIEKLDPNFVEPNIVTDVIREVNITLSEEGEDIVPVIGGQGAKMVHLRSNKIIRDLGRRVVNLERR